MPAIAVNEQKPREDQLVDGLIARLTLTAYDVALRQGVKGRFTDLQSDLWRELGDVIREATVQPNIRLANDFC